LQLTASVDRNRH